MTSHFLKALESRRLSRPVVGMIVGLLGFYVLMTLAGAVQKGLSYDEGQQIAMGYNIWARNDFRMEAGNGDLVKRWATLPLLVSKPVFPGMDNEQWRNGQAYEIGYSFFFELGNDSGLLLLQCRTMVALLGAATGLLIFFCSRELFGNLGGLISLGLFVTSPSMLAFGGMVSTEMTIFLTMLGSTWCIWRLLHRVTWGRLAGSLVFFGLLLLSKPTAVVVFPVTAILVIVKLWIGPPMDWRIGVPALISSRWRQIGVVAVFVVAHAVFGWASIWAHYNFRYVASGDPTTKGVVLERQQTDPIDPVAKGVLRWARRAHFLPQAYLIGTESLLGQNESQPAFMDGKWTIGGWPTFFPYAMWAKTPPVTLLLLLAAGVVWWDWWRLSRRGKEAAVSAEVAPGAETALEGEPSMRGAMVFYHAVPFVALFVVYMAIAVTSELNIGFRHVLPVYPAVYVLAGAVGLMWSAQRLILKAAVGLLLLGQAWVPFGIYPHYLAYFSPVVGGPAQGYKRLVDSSLDWGMDLPLLKRWLDKHNPGDRAQLYFAYFGTGNPAHYRIRSLRLPSRPEWREVRGFPLGPGIYAISATLYQGIGTVTMGPWNKVFEQKYQNALKNIELFDSTENEPEKRKALLEKYPVKFWNEEFDAFDKLRFGRLCAWLRNKRPPDDNVGYSILIWRLTKEDIFEAGLGPPVELAEAPVAQTAGN